MLLYRYKRQENFKSGKVLNGVAETICIRYETPAKTTK